ncbi:phosphoribosylamine--glycine ligase [Eggerthellaceae bacterium zg-997]|nr:phosphoribosylamine--glycine ligase [Eggerthellaceae bacterium zg-997]
MNILVLGSGGREHALARSIADSPRTDRLFVAPGNGGTAAFAQNVPQLSIEDGQAVLAFAQREDVQLVVVGPEAPLVAGVADALRQAGIDVFGPDAQGAQLEGSKTFSKRFMERNGIPTAAYGSFTDAAAARGFADQLGAPVVVKADGLAAGKGVVVAGTLEEAHAAIDECFSGAFGQAGAVVVVEECLTGPECSMLAFVSQGQALCMAPAQDHKRAFEGDAGPNTGGMGCYSPVPIVSDDELAAMQRLMQQAAEATAREFDRDYRGVLYGGFMLTPEGPKMLEFNARFGDPETQVVLPRLRTDLVDVLQAVAQGRPDDIRLEWADQWAVGVVLASAGYPGAYRKGLPIAGCDEAAQLEGVMVYHAGTARTADGGLVTAGGRVLCVTALGDTFEDARACAYSACTRIEFEGKQFRADIGERAARGRHAWGE